MKEVNSVSDATNTYGEDIKLTTTDASTLYKTIITELEKGAGRGAGSQKEDEIK